MYDTEAEGYQQDYDFFPESGELESVPGFGFWPVGINEELNLMTQVNKQISQL